MKFLCLGYYAPEKFERLSEAEVAEVVANCRPHDEKLHASGKLVSVASLAERTAATIRPRSGQPVVRDGPYAEAKEVIGSFFVVEADDLDEAIRIASLHPAARWGEHLGFGIEVRPIEHFVEI